jgi:hypothetical protein
MAEINSVEIYWTDKAKFTFSEIILFLENNWTEKEIETFVSKTFHIISLIQVNPLIFKSSSKRKNFHLAVIDKNNVLVYMHNYKQNRIEILILWDVKQNPKKLKF